MKEGSNTAALAGGNVQEVLLCQDSQESPNFVKVISFQLQSEGSFDLSSEYIMVHADGAGAPTFVERFDLPARTHSRARKPTSAQRCSA